MKRYEVTVVHYGKVWVNAKNVHDAIDDVSDKLDDAEFRKTIEWAEVEDGKSIWGESDVFAVEDVKCVSSFPDLCESEKE
jgi:hypothetical protein